MKKLSKYAAKGAAHWYSADYRAWHEAAKGGKAQAERLGHDHAIKFLGVEHLEQALGPKSGVTWFQSWLRHEAMLFNDGGIAHV